MALVVALKSGLYGAAYVHAGNAFHIDDDGVLEARLQAKDVRLATDADLSGSADTQPSTLNPQPPAPDRLTIDKLDDLPQKMIKTLRDAGFQFVDELTEASLTGKPGIGEASRLSILANVAKLTPAA